MMSSAKGIYGPTNLGNPIEYKIIELAETKTLGPTAIGRHPEVVKLNNGKKIPYGTIQNVITDEKGKKFFKEVNYYL